jgi:DNA-directed RNA polymerase specialized sigma24 family protein
MSQQWSTSLRHPRPELDAVFSEAYETLKQRLGPDRADDLGDAVVKWWTYVSRRQVPEYLLADGTISVRWLVHWLAQTADERRMLNYKREQKRREHGFAVVPDTNDEGEPIETCDRTDTHVDEAVISKLHARTIVEKLGGVDAIDPVLRYRALDFSYEEIGAALDVTPGAARVRMSRAVSRLASKLEHAA